VSYSRYGWSPPVARKIAPETFCVTQHPSVFVPRHSKDNLLNRLGCRYRARKLSSVRPPSMQSHAIYLRACCAGFQHFILVRTGFAYDFITTQNTRRCHSDTRNSAMPKIAAHREDSVGRAHVHVSSINSRLTLGHFTCLQNLHHESLAASPALRVKLACIACLHRSICQGQADFYSLGVSRSSRQAKLGYCRAGLSRSSVAPHRRLESLHEKKV